MRCDGKDEGRMVQYDNSRIDVRRRSRVRIMESDGVWLLPVCSCVHVCECVVVSFDAHSYWLHAVSQ